MTGSLWQWSTESAFGEYGEAKHTYEEVREGCRLVEWVGGDIRIFSLDPVLGIIIVDPGACINIGLETLKQTAPITSEEGWSWS